MRLIGHNPSEMVAPASAYAQGMEVRDATRWLLVSGQVGLEPDGSLAGDVRDQARRCFDNVLAVLQSAGMDRHNITKITAYLVNADDVGVYRHVRDQVLGGHVTASTLLVVSALAHPDWRVEIEAVAAA